MSDQLVHVRDRDGNETYVGQAWLDRWPDDFAVINDQTAPAPRTPQPAEPGSTGNTTSF